MQTEPDRPHRPAVLAALLMTALAGQAQTPAEAPFFQSLNPGQYGFPIYFQPGGREIAEDVPFTGNQLVSSFLFGYKASVPVRATFRFYGVDAATELPGAKLAEIQRDLAPGEAAITVALGEAEQFTFAAQSNLLPGNDAEASAIAPHTGGWFSVQFTTLDGSPTSAVSFRLADGPSYPYLNDAATGQAVGPFDASGVGPTRMYLQLDSIASAEVPIPLPVQLKALAPSVQAGKSTTAQTVLSAQIPHGGVAVSFKSSHPRLLSVPSTLTWPPGSSVVPVTLTASGRVSKPRVVTVTATANGASVSTNVTVTP